MFMASLKKIVLAVFILALLLCLDVHVCYGNSLSPPSIVILVPNAPDDLQIVVQGKAVTYNKNNSQIFTGRAEKEKLFPETYYVVYSFYPKSSDCVATITTGGEMFEIQFAPPVKQYSNVYTLDLKKKTLTPGRWLSRSVVLFSLRVFSTLIIEALVFFVFGYRSKRSWLIFLTANLLTQGLLYIILDVFGSPFGGGWLFQLLYGELVVFVIEAVVFSIFINEHGRLRPIFYILTANLLSLVGGGIMFFCIPV
jgi:hypothetical protein